MKISLYDYLMSLVSHCTKKDFIVVKSNSFYKQYDNIYKLLDRIHLMPEVKEYYKDYKVNDVRIASTDYGGISHRNIYISVSL